MSIEMYIQDVAQTLTSHHCVQLAQPERGGALHKVPMPTMELGWNGTAVLQPVSHLLSDPGSPGLTSYGASLPLGNFAHGKRAFPQQAVTLLAAFLANIHWLRELRKVIATCTGQLVEYGREGCVVGGYEWLNLDLGVLTKT